MASFHTEQQAADAGFTVVHEPGLSRYALYRNAKTGADTAQELIGEAHYTLGHDTIDFDHTVVSPGFRGTGLSQILAHRAVSSELTQGRHIEASCWFIANYLLRRPSSQPGDGPSA